VSEWVVDASVAVKWYVDEPHAEMARRLLADDVHLSAPGHLFAEVGNALVKHVRRGELSATEVEEIAATLAAFPIDVVPVRELFGAGVAIALSQRCSVYDGLYVALARELELPLVTADRRLVNALQGGPMAAHLRWVDELDRDQ
jgi:predicted nucleic acid-binding protein